MILFYHFEFLNWDFDLATHYTWLLMAVSQVARKEEILWRTSFAIPYSIRVSYFSPFGHRRCTVADVNP